MRLKLPNGWNIEVDVIGFIFLTITLIAYFQQRYNDAIIFALILIAVEVSKGS